ncbi:MAG: RluA family pseudouridine synthase [Clostridia bacterium]|nr:RluA family pseudouridine synthase [Clostridia bacterium]
MDFSVDSDFSGRFLRDFLYKKLSLSRALLSDLKKKDGIRVNGERATVRFVLNEGDTVSLALEDTYDDCDISLYPYEMPLDIIYEDEHIMAINKPPYMPTHLSHGHRLDTLANALKAEFDKRGKPFVMRAVNRLDGDTSGIVIIAKNRYAADRFAKTNKDINYEKLYTAFCRGTLPEAGEIKSYIRRVEESIITRASYDSGKESEFAHTRYRAIERKGDISVVECEPITGRTHQLRVHFSSLGAPIVGDDLYGGGKDMPRQALHARVLRFTHPFTGERVELIAPLPEDMEIFLKEIQNEI